MERQIYYHDTDAGGVVYYGNYLKYMEEARTEFLEKRGFSVQSLQKQGIIFAVRKCTVIYRSPARYGDTITCDATLTKITAAQLIFDQKIFDKPSQTLLVESEVNLVCLTSDFKPTSIPDHVRAQLV